MAFQFNLQNCSSGTCNYGNRYGDTTIHDFLASPVRWFCPNDKTIFARVGWFSEKLGGAVAPPARTPMVFPTYARLGRGLPTAVSSTAHAPAHPPFSNHALSCPSLPHDSIHVVLSLPLPFTPSTSYEMLFFTQSPSSFHNTRPSHLNRFCFTTSDTNSIPILSISSDTGTVFSGR